MEVYWRLKIGVDQRGIGRHRNEYCMTKRDKVVLVMRNVSPQNSYSVERRDIFKMLRLGLSDRRVILA